METVLQRTLRGRRQETRARWEVLLRIERVNTPLANPDALVNLFNWTLDEVISKIGPGDTAVLPAGGWACECGRNPFVAYFKAAKQALMEALVLEQAETPLLDPIDRDRAMAELRSAVDWVGQNEVAAFCALCTHRSESVPAQSDRERGDPAEEE